MNTQTAESSPQVEGGSAISEGFPTEAWPRPWAKGPVLLRLSRVWNQENLNLKILFNRLQFLSSELSLNAHLSTL